MTLVLATLRRWWTVIAAGLALFAVALVYLLRPKKAPEDQLVNALDLAKARAREKVAAAQARAEVEITIARDKDSRGKGQLEAILAEPDEERRRKALIEMARRMRREGTQ